jgi:hypothetical protein
MIIKGGPINANPCTRPGQEIAMETVGPLLGILGFLGVGWLLRWSNKQSSEQQHVGHCGVA